MLKKLLLAALLLCLLVPGALAEQAELDSILALPGKQDTLHDLTGTTTDKVIQITGEDSPNKTQSRFGVWGTDLGSIARLGDQNYKIGGGTFGDQKNAHRSRNEL